MALPARAVPAASSAGSAALRALAGFAASTSVTGSSAARLAGRLPGAALAGSLTGVNVGTSLAALLAAFAGFASTVVDTVGSAPRGAAFAVAARDAGVADRAAATRRLLLESSTTTVTPASARVRRSFLAWLGFTAASSTARATSSDVS